MWLLPLMIHLQSAKNLPHDILAQMRLREVRAVQAVEAVAAEDTSLHIRVVCVAAVDEQTMPVFVHQLLTNRVE